MCSFFIADNGSNKTAGLGDSHFTTSTASLMGLNSDLLKAGVNFTEANILYSRVKKELPHEALLRPLVLFYLDSSHYRRGTPVSLNEP